MAITERKFFSLINGLAMQYFSENCFSARNLINIISYIFLKKNIFSTFMIEASDYSCFGGRKFS